AASVVELGSYVVAVAADLGERALELADAGAHGFELTRHALAVGVELPEVCSAPAGVVELLGERVVFGDPLGDRTFERLDASLGPGQCLVAFGDADLEVAQRCLHFRNPGRKGSCPLLSALGVTGALGEQLLELGDL